MGKKFGSDKNYDTKELASQLRHPHGEMGKEVGLEMNKGNVHICLNSYKLLRVSKGHNILEIGMGNGFFVKDLLRMEDDLHYTGADFSEEMVMDAKKSNIDLINSGRVIFEKASIEKLPFADAAFDRITTTNTIYFWPNPVESATELLRVLKPGGMLLVAYRTKSCMDQMAFSEFGFSKYDPSGVEGLLEQAGYTDLETQTIEEPELEFDGIVHRMKGYFTTGIN